MKSGNRELVDRLAAEYVLGTLRGRARRRFERWLVSPQVGDIVKGWEARLAGLEPRLEAVTPPSTVWRGIENRLALRRKPVTRWLAVAASLLVFAVIGFYAMRQPPAVPLAATQKALIQENPQTIYWSVELLGRQPGAGRAGAGHARARARQGARALGIARARGQQRATGVAGPAAHARRRTPRPDGGTARRAGGGEAAGGQPGARGRLAHGPADGPRPARGGPRAGVKPFSIRDLRAAAL
jgi:hypothetical protein